MLKHYKEKLNYLFVYVLFVEDVGQKPVPELSFSGRESEKLRNIVEWFYSS